MWDDSRAALGDLDLGGRTRILDVGCGTGEFTRVLAEASEARVVGVDADTDLLSVASDRDSDIETVAGDATRLPFAAGSFDLVVCQALLVNLPDPRGRPADSRRRVPSGRGRPVRRDDGASVVGPVRRAEPMAESPAEKRDCLLSSRPRAVRGRRHRSPVRPRRRLRSPPWRCGSRRPRRRRVRRARFGTRRCARRVR